VEPSRRFGRVLVLAACLLVVGSSGYHYLEGWSWLDGLYMTMITVATVGFGEVHPQSVAGRFFTMGLIVVGVSVVGYALTQMTNFVVEGQLNNVFRRRAMERLIRQMSDHYIVCGYGRIGRAVVQEFVQAGVPFVIVTRDDPGTLSFEDREVPVIVGDASDEEVLQRAGIERAKGLVAALPDDADNVLVTMTARDLNLDIVIVARAAQNAMIRKLRRAGANRVISPYELGGRRMASIVLRPAVVDFLDVMMHSGEVEIRLEEMTIPVRSPLDGKTIRDARIGERTGAIILAVRTLDGKTVTNPGPGYVLRAWEQLIVMGSDAQIRGLRAAAEP